jgi:hypothetical protein
MNAPLLKRIDVWRPLSSGRALRYNCLEDVATGRFRVCTADFIEPGRPHDREQARYFVEAVLAWNPTDPEQPTWYPSLDAAIAAHDADFPS